MQNRFHIGEVAKSSGVSIDAIRYYERRNLLPAAPRTTGGFRIFTAATIDRVRFIRQAQELGFTLDEIATLIGTENGSECIKVRDLITDKLADLDERLKRMREFRKTLAGFLVECEEELRKHADSPECPVLIEIAHSGN